MTKSYRKSSRVTDSLRIAACESLESRRLFAAGDLDTTFGNAGRVTIPFPVVSDPANPDFVDRGVEVSALDSRNGMTVVAGDHHTGSLEAGSQFDDRELAIARLDANGQLDPTFDTDGMMYHPILAGVSRIHVQSDNKILVVGPAQGATDDMILVRFNADGSLDTGFGGGDGFVDFVFQPAEVGQTPDGKIVVSGTQYIEANDLTVLVAAQLLNDGSLNDSYGVDGVAVTNFPYGSGPFLAVQPNNGKAILASSVLRQANPIDIDVSLIRLTTAGTPDGTFSEDGQAFANSIQFDDVSGMDIAPNGDIFIALGGGSGSKISTVLTKVGSGGTQRLLFEALDVSSFVSGVKAAFNSSGQIYVFARVADSPQEQAYHDAIIRYNADGMLDRTFGSSGKGYIFTESETNEAATPYRGDLQNDMKIVTVRGEVTPGTGNYQAIVSRRLSTDPTSPPTSPPPTSPPVSPPPTSPPTSPPVSPPTSPPTSPPVSPPPVGALPGTLAGSMTTLLPSGLIGQQKIKAAKVIVAVTNPGSILVKGKTSFKVFVSTDATFDGHDRGVVEKSPNLKLKPGQTKNVKIPVRQLPLTDAGTYQLGVKIIAPDQTVTEVFDGVTFPVAAPVIDLTPAIAQGLGGTLSSGGKAVVRMTVQNTGNVPAKGLLTCTIAASADAADSVDDLLIASKGGNVNIKPGRSRTIKVPFRVPGTLTPGAYFVVAKVDTQGTFAESDEANNLVISAGTFTVV